MTKNIVHSTSGKKLFFGRNKPKAIFPRLSLKNYLNKSLPNPPTIWNWRRLAQIAISQMYLNDSEGDCVIAAMCHSLGVITGNSIGKPFIFTDQQVNSLYSTIGGYVPGDPSTDNGCDIQTALNYWGVNGLLPSNSAAHKIQGYLAVNPSDKTEIQLAVFLFENLIFGLDLPDGWVTPFPSSSGFVWDSGSEPDSNNGHCVTGFGYNSQGVNISTWALDGILTYSAINQYCSQVNQGELYAVISQDSISRASSRAPNGFDWSQLLADFQAIKV